jgi:xanthine dehydrogenase accessory factor
LAIAEVGGASATLSARLEPDGRVQRTLGSGVSERKLARLAEESWTEPLGLLVRAVYLFGAGHVGRALALALAPLPFAVRWIDPRRDAFPTHAPVNVTLIHAPEPPAELVSAPDSALVVVMTHSHALDLEIVAEALRVERFGYVGLIGSATKRARFLSQMRAAGRTEVQLARLVCPIGVPGLESKDPAVIAASTAAQLLIVSESLAREEDEAPLARRRNASPASAL